MVTRKHMKQYYSKDSIDKRDRIEMIVLLLIIMVGIQLLPATSSSSQSQPKQGLTQ